MAVVKESKPVTPRDHEIIALMNRFLDCCAHQSHAVILAALAQTFLVVLSKSGDDIPLDVQVTAKLLSNFCVEIRALPQDRKH